MDVNGTKFHLLQNMREDWGECFSEGSDQPLIAAWSNTGAGIEADVEYDDASKSLRLRSLTTKFRRFARRSDTQEVVDIEQRRGAAADQYGNIFWIDDAGTGILRQGSQSKKAVRYWTSTVSQAPVTVIGPFHPVPKPQPLPFQLYGLTVTKYHYLVVGYVQKKNTPLKEGESDIEQSGVLIFDLYQNNLPDQRVWPHLKKEGESDAPAFIPWDIAPAADGGVYILDRDSKSFWVLDKRFRVPVKLTTSIPFRFHPVTVTSSQTEALQDIELTGHYPLNLLTEKPISIEAGPDGRVFILDQGDGTSDPVFDGTTNTVKGKPPAVIVFQEDPKNPGTYTFVQRLILRVRIPDAAIEQGRIIGQIGQDFIYAEADSRFYIADQEGNQVIAFVWPKPSDGSTSTTDVPKIVMLDGEPDYIPLRRWGGRGLVSRTGRIYYDYIDHWVPTQPFDSCEFARRAVILTPTEFDPGQTFDSTILGCVWHRILLDAEIPAATSVSFRARAADDQDLLPFMPWEDQPLPYLRTNGSELPYYRHPGLPAPVINTADLSLDQLNENPPPAGTWELLFQAVRGRYLQLEITLEGTGRSTPQIYALRVWYPRFSYLEHYLPAIYREEPVHADFLDRWLANFEGVFTNLEDRIQNLPRLIDPRSAPAEALDWLAKWMGLILDPLWSEEQRRFFIRHVSEFYKRRGTREGMELTLRLYMDENLDESTFWTDTSFHQYLRIEELCIRRDLKDFTDPFAHRFVILVPDDTDSETVDMIDRIANLEKPAHTLFQLQSSTDSFVVGQALLGLDTQLGINTRGTSGYIRLNQSRLLNGYLSPSYPLDVEDRLVMERDQLGDLPEL